MKKIFQFITFLISLIIIIISVLIIPSCQTIMDNTSNSTSNIMASSSSVSSINGVIIASFDNFSDINNLGGSNSDFTDTSCFMNHTYSETTYDVSPNSARLLYKVIPTKWGAAFVIDFGGAKDFSSYSKLIMAVKGGDSSSDNPHHIKLEWSDASHDGWAHTRPKIPDDTDEKTPITHVGFTTYTIPFTKFENDATFDTKNLTKLTFVFNSAEVSTDIGEVYIDDIRVE